MAAKYTIALSKIVKTHGFDVVYAPKDISEIMVSSPDVYRPGLIFAGFEKYFDPERIQFLGASEDEYIKSYEQSQRKEIIERLLSKKPVAVVLTRNLKYSDEFIELAKEYGVPLLSTAEGTSSSMSTLIAYLNVELAPRITRHGVFVEIYGEGVLILGDSGVGKSETALELVNRGHRLIADDAVEIRKVSHKTLVGSAPENIRHFIELRGVGVINARRLFGIGSVKISEKIDMVVQLEPWDSEKTYDRMGLENEKTEILGISIPSLTIPVKPGRNLAVIIEVASMNNRQKKMGYNAAHDLLKRLGMEDAIDDSDSNKSKDVFD